MLIFIVSMVFILLSVSTTRDCERKCPEIRALRGKRLFKVIMWNKVNTKFCSHFAVYCEKALFSLIVNQSVNIHEWKRGSEGKQVIGKNVNLSLCHMLKYFLTSNISWPFGSYILAHINCCIAIELFHTWAYIHIVMATLHRNPNALA